MRNTTDQNNREIQSPLLLSMTGGFNVHNIQHGKLRRNTIDQNIREIQLRDTIEKYSLLSMTGGFGVHDIQTWYKPWGNISEI